MDAITLHLPDDLLDRLRRVAAVMRRPLEEVLLRALRLGSPPSWDDAPAGAQSELAAMDALDDDALFVVLREHSSEAETGRYEELDARRTEGPLSQDEERQISTLREESDRRALRRAHAAVLLRWRGRAVPFSLA